MSAYFFEFGNLVVLMCLISPLLVDSFKTEVRLTVVLFYVSFSCGDALRLNVLAFFSPAVCVDCMPEPSSNEAEILSGISGCTYGGVYSVGYDSSCRSDLDGLASVNSVSSTVCRYWAYAEASAALFSTFLAPKT